MSRFDNEQEALEERMGAEAIALLEGPMRRRNWSPNTKDEIAERLVRIVRDELKIKQNRTPRKRRP